VTRVLSGVQPSGDMHIGNYLGAFRSWVASQAEHDSFYCIVDLHALTSEHDRGTLADRTLAAAAVLLAVGLDPAQCTLFVQSHVPEHTQLAWLLECTATMGELRRMTQFKEKPRRATAEDPPASAADAAVEADAAVDADASASASADAAASAAASAAVAVAVETDAAVGEASAAQPETAGSGRRAAEADERVRDASGAARVGLFTYPVLMAADILLYDADRVPVGDDQRQHLELARTLASRFNSRYGATFVVPQAAVPAVGARVMDLQDPTRKMSKSVSSPQGTVSVLDPPDVVRRKVRRAVTDTDREVRHDPDSKPGVSNLLELLAAATSGDPVELADRYQEYGALKDDVADALVELLRPVRARYDLVMADPGELRRVLTDGAGRARQVAAATLARASTHMGLLAAG